MEYKSLKYLSGPNQYAIRSVIRRELNLGPFAAHTTNDIGNDFCKTLLNRYSRLGLPKEARETHEFLRRLSSGQGAPISEAVLFMILGLEEWDEEDSIFIEHIEDHESPSAQLIWRSKDQEASRRASELALLCVRELLPEKLKWKTAKAEFDFEAEVTKLRRYIDRKRPCPDNLMLIKSAEQRDIPWDPLGGLFVMLGQGKFQKLIRCAVTSETRNSAALLADRKDISNNLLANLGLPVPRQLIVSSKKDALIAAKRIGFPIVVKPRGGSGGRGISANILNEDEIPAAYENATKISRRVIVETFLDGNDYRILVINGRVIAVAKRIPPKVKGDGKTSIGELVANLNNSRDGKKLFKVKVNGELSRLLKKSGYTLKSVLNKDEVFVLSSVASFSVGGVPIDVTDLIHPDNKKMAVRAAEAVGLDVAGIDFVSPDIARSYKDVGGGILEIGAFPGLRLHYWPAEGTPRDVTGPIIDLLYPNNSRSRVPIAVLTGTSSPDCEANILAHILHFSGMQVGLSTSKDVVVEGESIGSVGMNSAEAACSLLKDPRIETMLRAVTVGNLADSGLLHDHCDVSAIFDAAEIDSNGKTAELHNVIRTLNFATRNHVVVSADDPEIMSIVSDLSPSKLCLVSSSQENPSFKNQIKIGGRAVHLHRSVGTNSLRFFEKGRIVYEMPLAGFANSKALVDGQDVSIAALKAAAIAWNLGVDLHDIRVGLNTLIAEVCQNQVQYSVHAGQVCKVLVSDVQNAKSMRHSYDLIGRWEFPSQRHICFLEPLSSEQLSFIDEKHFVHPQNVHYYCRDKSTQNYLICAGISDDRIMVIPNTTEMITAVFKSLEADDCVAIFSNDRDRVEQLLNFGQVKNFPSSDTTVAVPHERPTKRKDNIPKKNTLWTGKELADITGGTWFPKDGGQINATGFNYNRNKIRPGDVVLTFNPKQWDSKMSGNKWIDGVKKLPEIFDAGAVAAIVHRVPKDWPPERPLLLVENTRKALTDLALASRKRFTGKTVAVIGSVGKTTTREILHHVLGKQAPTFATVDNWNHTRGVLGSLAQTHENLGYAVYETSMPARPKSLAVKPDVAIITNIRREHLEFYHTLEGIADDKAKIFEGMSQDGTAVISRDDPQYERLAVAAGKYGVQNIISFGTADAADVRLVDYTETSKGGRVNAEIFGQPISYEISLPGRHVAINTLGALAVAKAVGADYRQAALDIASVPVQPSRLQREKIPFKDGQIELIDDGFSINPSSLKAGLKVFSSIRPGQGGRRLLVLGEIHELGRRSRAIHAELGEDVINAKVDKVFSVGGEMLALQNAIPKRMRGGHYDSPELLSEHVLRALQPGDVVFVKGSRRTVDAIAYITDLLRSKGDPAKAPKPPTPLHRTPDTEPEFVKHDAPAPDIVINRPKFEDRFEILFVGDTGYGENYQEKREKMGDNNILKQNGYAYPLSRMRAALQASDLTIANLETPLTDMDISPFEGEKNYIHWGHVEHTPNGLLEHNISAVSLANNHTFDFGRPGFEQTLNVLNTQGIHTFGAGRSLAEAVKPLVIESILDQKKLRLALISAYQISETYKNKYDCYASNTAGGIAPLDPKLLADEIENLKRSDPSTFVVVYPHWGPNYKWRTDKQYIQADIMIEAGADLILGHGAHMMQEVEQRGGRWIVYSLGNFMFNSPGRYQLLNAPPYSFLAKLIAKDCPEGFALVLRLYPIFTDNLRNGYRTRFLKQAEFDSVVSLLLNKSPTPQALKLQMIVGQDDTGHHVDLDLGTIPGTVETPSKQERDYTEQDKVTCLECGQKFKSLTNHLSRTHKMKTSDYRKKWNLPEEHSLNAT